MATKTKNGRQNYDWDLIKLDYIGNDLSLRKIAEKYGINVQTVYKKSKADNWFATKKQSKAKVVANALAKNEKNRTNELARVMDGVTTLSERMLTALADTEQFNRHIVTETAPAPEGIGVISVTYEKLFDKVDTKAAHQMMQVLKSAAELLGQQKASEIEKQKIERERLALEREKFEWEKQKALESNGQTNTETCGVVMMPPILGDES